MKLVELSSPVVTGFKCLGYYEKASRGNPATAWITDIQLKNLQQKLPQGEFRIFESGEYWYFHDETNNKVTVIEFIKLKDGLTLANVTLSLVWFVTSCDRIISDTDALLEELQSAGDGFVCIKDFAGNESPFVIEEYLQMDTGEKKFVLQMKEETCY